MNKHINITDEGGHRFETIITLSSKEYSIEGYTLVTEKPFVGGSCNTGFGEQYETGYEVDYEIIIEHVYNEACEEVGSEELKLAIIKKLEE